jgi:hypothetical protein
LPAITRGMVTEKIARYWPELDPEEIFQVLDGISIAGSEENIERVQLAVLKLSEGRQERLRELVAMARKDYRDVLAYAEYPEEMRIGFLGVKGLSPQEVEDLRRRDREQYLRWLEGLAGSPGE